ncbi:MAG: YeeE/YedE family protein [Burkholderiales bacterium]|nr:YeeE/YedE family protein [Burkholderiales bacterium]
MLPLNDAGIWSGLACGLAFGVVLERAGFGSPCKLTAQFRLNDWSVFKVMFTAIVVAATGLWLLRVTGLLAEDALYVPTSYLGAAALGGALVGAGFAIGGYCPGTSVVGLFSGRADALLFIVGLLLGTFVFAAAWGPSLESLTTWGELDSGDTFAEAFGLPDMAMLGMLGAALVAVYLVGGRMERSGRGPVSAAEAVAGANDTSTRT